MFPLKIYVGTIVQNNYYIIPYLSFINIAFYRIKTINFLHFIVIQFLFVSLHPKIIRL